MMNNLKPLTGFELVKKGITKTQATLPEVGWKDAYPNGSWLEQKQIQAAIDARKHLLSVDRIEKRGTLSHAEWRENLMLAEVTQNTGGHWQFMGHNIGKQLYLTPEETLFLMEMNCLLLKHNDVKVSLQQAYSLLCRDKISLTQYMVYASLSKIGYKVIKHKEVIPKKGNPDERGKTQDKVLNISLKQENKEDEQINDSEKKSNDNNCAMEVASINCDNKSDSAVRDVNEATTTQTRSDVEHEVSIYLHQIQKIRSRSFNPSDAKKLSKCFKNLSNVLQCETVTVNVPEMEFVPENIRFNKTIYTLNLKEVKSKRTRRISRRYSVSDEANGSHIRRLKNVSESSARRRSEDSLSTQSPRLRFMDRYPLLRPYNFWRPQRENYFPFNMPYHRPFRGMFPPRRFQYFPRYQGFYRPHFLANPNRMNERTNPRKRRRENAQGFHFDSMKRLAARLKGLVRAGAPQMQSLHALNRLIQTYNNRYKTAISLNDDYEIVEGETVVETIEIEDDDEIERKRPRLGDTYTENVDEIKKLAVRLKELASEGKATARHRRAFSSLVRTFNKSYNAEICMSGDYEVSDRRYITLDSSSESDCVVNEPKVKSGGGKKLRNPFNVLKRLSEKRAKRRSACEPGKSSDDIIITQTDPVATDPYKDVEKSIGEGWLPSRDDFGRPEIPTAAAVYTDNMIYNYAKYHNCDWGSWAELKMAYFSSMEESTAAFVREECHSIIKPEDCKDMMHVMKKLSVIKPAEDPPTTTLKLVYDVYNRDVQNFKKTRPPTPHFRVLCFDQSSTFPTGEDIAGLYSRYNDGVLIVFAIVHEGSISYLQIKNVNLPLYLSNSNLP